MFEHAYGDLPEHLVAQRQAMARRLGVERAGEADPPSDPPPAIPMRGQRTRLR
jgi:hypothetical protein